MAWQPCRQNTSALFSQRTDPRPSGSHTESGVSYFLQDEGGGLGMAHLKLLSSLCPRGVLGEDAMARRKFSSVKIKV